MAKFIFAAVALVASAFGVQAGDVSTCTAVNFTAKATDFSSLNAIIDLAVSSGLLTTFLADVDPLVLTDETITTLDFSLLGLDFELTPVIDSLTVTGISTVAPRHVNVTSANTVDLGADFTGTIAATATLTLSIQQLNHQWWQICWTDILNPSRCGPTSVSVDVAIAVDQPTVIANVLADMLACPAGASSTVCRALTVSQILIAAVTGQLEAILDRILLRIVNADVESLSLAFNSISELSFSFHDSSAFITQIIKSLLDFSVEEINKKGSIYTALISILNTVGKSLLNNLITSELAPRFGATCFDEGY